MTEFPKQVSFVIPVRNDPARLKTCLATIAANFYQYDLVECVVGDNGSTDNTAEVASRSGARVIPVPGVPVSAVRNRAAAVATGKYLAFVDADHGIAPGWIAAAVGILASPDVGAAGALCLPPPEGTPVQRIYGVLRGKTQGQQDTTWLGSGNLVVRRSLFQSLGGFDESLETCEDVDLCHRIRGAGMRLVADERLENIHYGDPATLAAVYTSERWRGRDNLRVSLRTRPTLRDWPSILIPIIGAFCLASIPVLVAARLFAQWPLLAIAAPLFIVLGLAGLRWLRMAFSGRLTPADFGLAYAVALSYDLGRAVSLFFPAGHGQRKVSDRTTTDRR